MVWTYSSSHFLSILEEDASLLVWGDQNIFQTSPQVHTDGVRHYIRAMASATWTEK